MNVTETVKLLVGIGLDLGMHQVSSLLNVAQSVLFLLDQVPIHRSDSIQGTDYIANHYLFISS